MDLEGESASEEARVTKGEESGRGERESATGKDEPQPLGPVSEAAEKSEENASEKRGGEGVKKTPRRENVTGKAKRREKRLRNEPQSVAGEETPLALNVLDFAEARANELHNMTKALEAKPVEAGKRVFQQLPRHMRRRAMSHNVRRLPRRLKEKAIREMDKQSTATESGKSQKKKSRRQRRRPQSLRDEYSRRQRDNVWLETHMWHAKRMHMRDYYGYRVAERANDKGVRQAYRSIRYGCLMSDMSYQCCIEMEGDREDILSSLSPFFCSDAGPTIAARAYADGSRAGHAMMYHADQYPYGAIGPIEFLWQPPPIEVGDAVQNTEISVRQTSSSQTGQTGSDHPPSSLETTTTHISPATIATTSQTGLNTSSQPVPSASSTKLWLVVSPAIYKETLTEISTSVEQFRSRKFKHSQENVASDRSEVVKSSQHEKEREKMADPDSLELSTESNDMHLESERACEESLSVGEMGGVPGPAGVTDGLTVRSLKDELVRFRLVGPRSHALVMETLKPVVKPVSNEATTSPNHLSTPPPDLATIPDTIPWWDGNENLNRHNQLLSTHYERLKTATTPTEFPRGTILGMVVQDPRLFTPSKKTDMVSEHYPKKKGPLGRFGVDRESGVKEGEKKVGKKERKGGEDLGSDVSSVVESEEEEESVASGSEHEAMEGSLSDGEDEREKSSGKLRRRALDVVESAAVPLKLPTSPLAYSPLWDPLVRETVKDSRIPDHILNNARSKLLVKSSVLDLGQKAPRVPVLLIQQSLTAQLSGVLRLGNNGYRGNLDGMPSPVTTSLVSGWDLVLPSNWAMAFWVSLVYRGARACGMTDLHKCYLECGIPFFPPDYPDTRVGRHFSEERGRATEEKFRRYPPDKRRNYGKLLIQDPFVSPWGKLVRLWQRNHMIERICSIPVAPVAKQPAAAESDSDEDEMYESGFDSGSGEETQVDEVLVEPPAKRPRIDGSDSEGLVMQAEPNEASGEPRLESDQIAVESGTASKEGILAERVGIVTVEDAPQDYYVLRSKSSLIRISHFLHCLFSQKLRLHRLHSNLTSHRSILSHEDQTVFPRLLQQQSFHAIARDHSIDSLLRENPNALITICFEMMKRGNVHEQAIISLPTSSDFRDLVSKRRFQGPEETVHPKGVTVVEDGVICVGVSGLTRKKTREVKMRWKTSAQERKKMEKKFGILKPSKKQVIQTIERDFNLQPATQSRVIIGYTTTAGYRLSSSKSGGTACCSLVGLLEAARKCYNSKASENGRIGEIGRDKGEEGGGEGCKGGSESAEGGERGGGEGEERGGGEGKGGSEWEEGEERGGGGQKGTGRDGIFELLVLIRGETTQHRFARCSLLH